MGCKLNLRNSTFCFLRARMNDLEAYLMVLSRKISCNVGSFLVKALGWEKCKMANGMSEIFHIFSSE